ncbi:carboxymuconolactone decarboxylase family protein [Thioalkalivibrio sp.]|uniref:carboxymuconolactone decarboxylase family protein n=1 Tax=Thioalkalivibrio sp. TaxID=2093813 RepID=UPI0035685929
MENPGGHETRSVLQEVAATFDDHVPNLYRMLARSQVALTAFVRFEDILERHGRLSRDEQAIVALEVAMSNRCNYCRGVMSREAREAGVTGDTVTAVLHGLEPMEPRYRFLVDATRRLIADSGNLGQAEVVLFEERGIPFDELLEIVSIIAAFTLATYANNLSRTRVDPEYR